MLSRIGQRVLFAMAVLVLALEPLAAQAWHPLGPAPLDDAQFTGRISALATSAKVRNRYYAAGASGGVWRSDNGGRTWRPLTDRLPTLAVGALAIDPRDERVLYAGSGEANYAYHSLYGLGLFKSSNRGKSWAVLAEDVFAGRTFARLAVSPADGSVWAAVARAGGTFRGAEGARLHPDRKRPLGLLRSRDGGRTWQRLTEGLPGIAASDVDFDPVDPGRVYVCFGDPYGHRRNGIYRSTDGGGSFHDISPSFAGRRVGRTQLAVAPSDPDRLYALVVRASTRRNTGGWFPHGSSTLAVFRSDDGGDSWSRSNPGNFQAGQGNYDSAIAVDPDDSDRFFVGGVFLLRSTNGGRTYQEVTPSHVDLHDIVFDAAGRIVVATDGGVYRSSDRGSFWIPRNGRLGTIQLYAGVSTHPADPLFLLGGTQDNGTNLRSPTGWSLVFGGDGGFTAVDPTNPGIFFVQFQGTANLFRTTDGGLSFVHSATGIDPDDRSAFQAPMVVDPNDPSRLLYGTQRIYESGDGGLTWAAVSGDLTRGPPAAIRSLAIAPSDSNVVYAVTNDSRVLVSANGGSVWNAADTTVFGWPRIMRQLAVDPVDADRAFLAQGRFGSGQVLATRDRGVSWNDVTANLPDRPVSTVAVHRVGNTTVVLAGTDDGVYLAHDSSNGALAWRRYGSKLPAAPVQDLVVDTAHGRLVAATLGRGFWTTRLPTLAD